MVNSKLIKTINEVADKYIILDSKYEEGRNYCIKLLTKQATNYTDTEEYCNKLEAMDSKELILFLIQLQKKQLAEEFNKVIEPLNKLEEQLKNK